PWFEGSFYGAQEVSNSLRQFSALIDDAELSQRTEALINREEARIRIELAPWRERLQGKRALLYTGGVKSWSIVSALQELGVTVVATGTKKSTEEDKARIRELMGEEAHLIEDGNPRGLLDLARTYQADILVAGGRNLYTALKARLPFLDINQEREHGYAGYQGLVTLARELARSLESPIWEAVRRPAPWAQGLTSVSSPLNRLETDSTLLEMRHG
ncbi:MAG: nitrogenase iron-molybdenum cofactor biosynthesis protein NifE, partial [Candidatus Competibacteraceae bacterium]|nr:nitrogenase iron-molybdenum cofactor biosynthesis protein NifE [Candidatus Competibacteraceae bacterium]